ncbi:hypothetical protein D3C76_918610 [compost metagenome]
MDAEKPNDVVTLLVRHRLRPGMSDDYERWLRRTVQTAKGYPGHGSTRAEVCHVR